jgi:hypothetical protein
MPTRCGAALLPLLLVVASCTATSQSAPADGGADGSRRAPSSTTSPAVQLLDPSWIRLPGAAPMAFAHGTAWVAASSHGDGSPGFLASIDMGGAHIQARKTFGLLLEDLDFAEGSLWVTATSGACVLYSCGMGGESPPQQPKFPRENSVTQWDARGLTLEREIPVVLPEQLEAGLGGVWVTSWADGRSSRLTKIDSSTGRILNTLRLPGDPGELAVSGGSVWELTSIRTNTTHGWTLLQVDPSTADVVNEVPLTDFRQGDPLSLASSGRTLAVTSFFDGDVLLFDARSGRAESSYRADLRITDVSIGPDGLWVVGDHSLLELDRKTGDVMRRLQVKGAPLSSVEQSREELWVTSARGVFRLSLG